MCSYLIACAWLLTYFTTPQLSTHSYILFNGHVLLICEAASFELTSASHKAKHEHCVYVHFYDAINAFYQKRIWNNAFAGFGECTYENISVVGSKIIQSYLYKMFGFACLPRGSNKTLTLSARISCGTSLVKWMDGCWRCSCCGYIITGMWWGFNIQKQRESL